MDGASEGAGPAGKHVDFSGAPRGRRRLGLRARARELLALGFNEKQKSNARIT